MAFKKRTHTCGELRSHHAGERVVLNAWVHKVRDLGGLYFADLRDRTGMVQVYLAPESHPNRAEIKPESCVVMWGTVHERDEKNKNPDAATGSIEVIIEGYEVLTNAKALPFPVSDESQMGSVSEELRLKYRYLDLRRPTMHKSIALRSAANQKLRSFLINEGFIEVETPIITKSTPEGARDYILPYRLQPGLFYALPQSPQQYKQLLMVAGIERYFQIARCFRDESSRADRQPEFSQLDIEMSFVNEQDIMELNERMVKSVVNELIADFNLDKNPVGPFARITYSDSMQRYGCDKPDIRFGLELFDASDAVVGSTFGVFNSALEAGGKIRGVRCPGGASKSRKEVGVFEEFSKSLGAKGMASLAILNETSEGEGTSLGNGFKVRGSITKFFTEAQLKAICDIARAEADDLLCFIADTEATCNSVLYRLRLEIGDELGLRDPKQLSYLWVTDFPLVEWDADGNRWSSMHHPFTMPNRDDLQLMNGDAGKVRAYAYDMVCNGNEAAGGSIRINDPTIQSQVFDLLGISPETQASQFGHLIEAFSYGAPPHGGIAWGMDRLIMLLMDTENIREVIAFPKTGPGFDPLMNSPSAIDSAQWNELGLMLKE